MNTICLGNIAIMIIGANSIGDEGLKEISAALKVNNTLCALHLDDNNIEDEGAKELAIGILFNTSLTHLYLRCV